MRQLKKYSDKIWIGIGIVALLGAAVFLGQQIEKINELQSEVSFLKTQLAALQEASGVAPMPDEASGGSRESRTAESPQCVDGDARVAAGDIYIASFGDGCTTSRMAVQEGRCVNGVAKSVTIACARGCSNGACVRQPGTNADPASGRYISIAFDHISGNSTTSDYHVTIYGNGGVERVSNKGAATSSIPLARIAELLGAFEQYNFWSFDDEYKDGAATGQDYTRISISVGGETKTVTHYAGDRNAPEELWAIEARFSDISQVAQ